MSKIHLPLYLTVLSVCLLAPLLPMSGLAQNIQLDPTFGVGGKVTVGFSDTGLRSSSGNGVFVQPSGRIVVVGGHLSGGQFGTFGLATCGLTSAGVLDAGFGSGGKTLEMDTSGVRAVQPLSNGQYLRLNNAGMFPQTTVVNRLNANGFVDSSFAANLNVGSDTTPVTMTMRSDGKIVILLRGVGVDDSHWLVRLNANGSRDVSFGTNGILLLNLRRVSRSAAIGLHVLPDNRILVGGYLSTTGAPSGGNVAWAVLVDEMGNYDRRFGLQGVVRIPFVGGVRISKTLLQPDGKLLLIGHAYGPANSRFMILRLTNRGRLDPGFGQNGIATAPNVTPDSFDVGYSAALMSDGRIAVVGTYAATQASPAMVLVARFGSNGVRESYAVSQFTPDQSSFAIDVASQPDGKLVVAGYTRNPDVSADGYLFAIARYTQ